MRQVILSDQTDFAGWRDAARQLIAEHTEPANVLWSVSDKSSDLFAAGPDTRIASPTARTNFRVPATFLQLAEDVALHRDPARFAQLYRLLWRLRTTPHLLENSVDPDIILARKMQKAVHRDQHKMHAFVRFREIGRGPNSRFIAWFEPDHYIVAATADFFARRFSDMEWSILTPDRCMHWDGCRVSFTEGAQQADSPSSDRLEQVWLSYYAHIFNPARLKLKMMQKEMPKKYWRNLPEAPLIRPLMQAAAHTTAEMITAGVTAPRASQQRRIERRIEGGDDMAVRKQAQPHGPTEVLRIEASSLKDLRTQAASCRACHLWKDATQTVFGEGAAHAEAMFVGEQPGDKEDLAGKPFIGPAGQMFDRALDEAGIDRKTVYVTNAVKHFKFVPRGKFRLHQKPNTVEIKACRPWFQHERELIKPRLVVAMGATAVQSVFGKAMPINANRSKLIDLDEGTKALITVHPSYLLRLPDEDAKALEYKRFVADLKLANQFLHQREAA
jgi:probable DNA metabolism protein